MLCAAHKSLLVGVGVVVNDARDSLQHLGKARVLDIGVHGGYQTAGAP